MTSTLNTILLFALPIALVTDDPNPQLKTPDYNQRRDINSTSNHAVGAQATIILVVILVILALGTITLAKVAARRRRQRDGGIEFVRKVYHRPGARTMTAAPSYRASDDVYQPA